MKENGVRKVGDDMMNKPVLKYVVKGLIRILVFIFFVMLLIGGILYVKYAWWSSIVSEGIEKALK